MPMQWVEPEVAFANNDDTLVYHVYRDDEFENRRDFWFTTDETASDCSHNQHVFDVRDLVRDLGNEPEMVEALAAYSRTFDLKFLYSIFSMAFFKGLIKMPKE